MSMALDIVLLVLHILAGVVLATLGIFDYYCFLRGWDDTEYIKRLNKILKKKLGISLSKTKINIICILCIVILGVTFMLHAKITGQYGVISGAQAVWSLL